jgi:hypothetical protein
MLRDREGSQAAFRPPKVPALALAMMAGGPREEPVLCRLANGWRR